VKLSSIHNTKKFRERLLIDVTLKPVHLECFSYFKTYRQIFQRSKNSTWTIPLVQEVISCISSCTGSEPVTAYNNGFRETLAQRKQG